MDPNMMEKEKLPKEDIVYDSNGSHDHDFEAAAPPASGGLARNLQGRHMQMIAIGMIPFAVAHTVPLQDWRARQYASISTELTWGWCRWINRCWTLRGVRFSVQRRRTWLCRTYPKNPQIHRVEW